MGSLLAMLERSMNHSISVISSSFIGRQKSRSKVAANLALARQLTAPFIVEKDGSGSRVRGNESTQ